MPVNQLLQPSQPFSNSYYFKYQEAVYITFVHYLTVFFFALPCPSDNYFMCSPMSQNQKSEEYIKGKVVKSFE